MTAMPPKKGSPKKKKKKEIDPVEEFWLTIDKSLLSRARLSSICSSEVNEIAPVYDAEPWCTPSGKKIHWVGIKHRTKKVSSTALKLQSCAYAKIDASKISSHEDDSREHSPGIGAAQSCHTKSMLVSNSNELAASEERCIGACTSSNRIVAISA